MRQVAIFRHNLFKISEPFITQQAQQLRRYKPLYLGRLRYGAAPADTDSSAMQDLVSGSPIPFVARQMPTRDPAPYPYTVCCWPPATSHSRSRAT